MLKRLWIIFFVLFAYSVVSAKNQDSLKVLFLGNSYFSFNDMPDMFRELARKTNRYVKIVSYSPDNTGLYDHANSSLTLSKIKAEKWDYVVVIGSSVKFAYPDHFTQDPAYPALEKLKSSILSNYDSTKIVLCMNWAFEDGMTWYQNWTDDFETMQNKIYIKTIDYSNNLDLIVAPVGWAWYKVLLEKEFPLHYLHSEDYNHPSSPGSYLSACVIFSTIYQESCEGNLYSVGIFEDEAAYFQEKASTTVLNNPTLWNLPSLSTSLNDILPVDIDIFPNPFTEKIQIVLKNRYTDPIDFELYTFDGKAVYSKKLSSKSNDQCVLLNLSAFDMGNYIVVLKQNQKILMSKTIQKL